MLYCLHKGASFDIKESRCFFEKLSVDFWGITTVQHYANYRRCRKSREVAMSCSRSLLHWRLLIGSLGFLHTVCTQKQQSNPSLNNKHIRTEINWIQDLLPSNNKNCLRFAILIAEEHLFMKLTPRRLLFTTESDLIWPLKSCWLYKACLV